MTLPHFLLLTVLWALSATAVAGHDGAGDYLRPGVDYMVLSPAQQVRVPADKIEVLDFFNFSCPHCFRMQGALAHWKETEGFSDVVLLHQPVVFQSHGGHYARTFHVLEALNVTERLYDKVFNAIHREGLLLNSKDRLLDFLAEKGVAADKAGGIYDSFSVNYKINRDIRIADSYGVSSTPQMAVAGKYLLSPALSGSVDNMLKTVSLLIARERHRQQ